MDSQTSSPTENHASPSPNTPPQQPAPNNTLTRTVGKTTYNVILHFSDRSRETLRDKILRLASNELQ